MTSGSERPVNDDELIMRLRDADRSHPHRHDPFFDLPAAHEVSVEGDRAYRGEGPQCEAPARRPAAVQGAYGTQVYEPVSCQLEKGHQGAHQAGFSRTHVLHHWHAFEWDG